MQKTLSDGAKKLKKKTRKQKVTVLLILVLLLAVIAIPLYFFGLVRFPWQKTQEDQKTERSDLDYTQGSLLTPEDLLPGKLRKGAYLNTDMLEDVNGEKADLSALGENIWLVFWASWCPDCEKQLAEIEKMEAFAETYQAKLVLIDRVEEGRETKKQAMEALEKMDASPICLYDIDRKLFDEIEAKEIPTHIVLDSMCRVLAYDHGVLEPAECEGLLQKAVYGPDASLLTFLQKEMTENGGIRSRINTEGLRSGDSDSSDQIVLSETQGLLMQASVLLDNKELFLKADSYVQDKMLQNHLPVWYVGLDGEKAGADALLDDLRIYVALHDAAEKWKEDFPSQASELQSQASDLADTISVRLVDQKDRLVDYCDLTNGEQATTISLCYLDISTLEKLCTDLQSINKDRVQSFEKSIRQAEEILEGGYISDEFPLYYSSYDYNHKLYSSADLNTAEALYTLLHLSVCGKLPATSLNWLKTRVQEGNLYAGYTVEGTVSADHAYHSTAVYGLAALIAASEGEQELFELAVRRMERLRVKNADNRYYGAFVSENSPIYAFDQCIPLLVYAVASQGNL